MTVVLDSSAVLAALWGDAGSDRVEDCQTDSLLSAVSLAEIVAKLVDRGATADEVDLVLSGIASEVVPFDADQARVSGLMRGSTPSFGLSLGDRSCLALALQRGLPVLTADRAWAEIDVGAQVEVIR